MANCTDCESNRTGQLFCMHTGTMEVFFLFMYLLLKRLSDHWSVSQAVHRNARVSLMSKHQIALSESASRRAWLAVARPRVHFLFFSFCVVRTLNVEYYSGAQYVHSISTFALSVYTMLANSYPNETNRSEKKILNKIHSSIHSPGIFFRIKTIELHFNYIKKSSTSEKGKKRNIRLFTHNYQLIWLNRAASTWIWALLHFFCFTVVSLSSSSNCFFRVRYCGRRMRGVPFSSRIFSLLRFRVVCSSSILFFVMNTGSNNKRSVIKL